MLATHDLIDKNVDLFCSVKMKEEEEAKKKIIFIWLFFNVVINLD